MENSKTDPIDVLTSSTATEVSLILKGLPFAGIIVPLLALFNMARPAIVLVVLLTPGSAAFLATEGFPPVYETVLGIACICLAIASAHIFNDYCDVEVDRLNERASWRPLVVGLVEPRTALFVSILLAILSFVCAILINWIVAVILVGGIFLIYSYSAKFKLTPYGFIPPALAAFLIPLGAFAAYDPGETFCTVCLLVAFSGFFFELVPFWTQTLPDIEGDKTRNMPTFAILFGKRTTAIIILCCFSISLALLVLLGFAAELGMPYFLVIATGGIATLACYITLVAIPEPRVALPAYLISLAFIGAVSVVIMLEKAYGAKARYFEFAEDILRFLKETI